MENLHTLEEIKNLDICGQHDNDEDTLFAFIPPLHIQRKRVVLDKIMDFVFSNRIENSHLKVIDIGCEKGAFFQYFQTELIGIKTKFDTTYIGIDISDFTLSSETIENLNKFSMGSSSNIRNGSISVKLLHENVLQPSILLDRPDVLVMIEVIEHIQLNDVNKKLPHSIFGDICPKVAIITTPNADFNEIFGLKDRSEFRHWDHKFEWTRAEFKCWCELVIDSYPAYIFEISDIGTSELHPFHGGGSQMAVFIRTESQPNSMSARLILHPSIVFEKDNLFPALFEHDVVKNFVSFKMSSWAIENHVFIDDCEESTDDNCENLFFIEYDEFSGCDILKISVVVIEKIIHKQFPNANINFWSVLEDCVNESIYFKLTDDKKYIYYSMKSEKDDEDEQFIEDFSYEIVVSSSEMLKKVEEWSDFGI